MSPPYNGSSHARGEEEGRGKCDGSFAQCCSLVHTCHAHKNGCNTPGVRRVRAAALCCACVHCPESRTLLRIACWTEGDESAACRSLRYVQTHIPSSDFEETRLEFPAPCAVAASSHIRGCKLVEPENSSEGSSSVCHRDTETAWPLSRAESACSYPHEIRLDAACQGPLTTSRSVHR